MGKSLGNAYTQDDLIKRGYDPIALRYFYLSGHYRKQINFTWDAFASAASALSKLRGIYQSAKDDSSERTSLSSEKMGKIEQYQNQFKSAIENDLNLPEALSTVWEVAKSNIPSGDKVDLLTQFDRVMGLDLIVDHRSLIIDEQIPEQVEKLIEQREAVRKMRNYAEADKIRADIEKLGYRVEDKGGRTRAIKMENG